MGDWFNSHFPPLLLSIIGGAADFLTSDEHSFLDIFIYMFLAGFCGYMVLLLCIYYEVPVGLQGFTCGVVGLSSRSILKIFKKFAEKRVRYFLGEKDEGEGENEK